MRPIGIITDSHSSITQEEAKQLGIWVLPMPFYIDGECYLEGVNLTREEFFEKLENGYMVQNIFEYLEYLKSSSREKDMARIPLVESYIEKSNKL